MFGRDRSLSRNCCAALSRRLAQLLESSDQFIRQQKRGRTSRIRWRFPAEKHFTVRRETVTAIRFEEKTIDRHVIAQNANTSGIGITFFRQLDGG